MAYATKYRFKFDDIHGNHWGIYLSEDGYSGPIIDRPLGGAPVLRRENNGHIYGTSLEFLAECQEDQEFTSLYTSNPLKYKVEVSDGTTDIWSGFVSPELYSEPDIAPPYNVSITAVDGLGELKLHTYSTSGLKSLNQAISDILSLTGFSGSMMATSLFRMKADSLSAASTLANVTCDFSHLNGQTCYDALEAILTTLNASITRVGDSWVLFREADITNNDTPDFEIDEFNGNNYWPIGNMESEIEPARKSVAVITRDHYKPSLLANPKMTSDTGWSKSYGVEYVSARSAYLLNKSDFTTSDEPRIWQSLALSVMTSSAKCHIRAKLKEDVEVSTDPVVLRAYVKFSTSSRTYYLQPDGDLLVWTETAPTAKIEFDMTLGYSYEKTFDFEIPAVPDNSIGTLYFALASRILYLPGGAFYSYPIYVFESGLTCESSEGGGIQLTVKLDNGARGTLDDIETSFSDTIAPGTMSGIPMNGSTSVAQWSSAKLGAQSYIGFIAMDNALLVANPRMWKKGKCNVPSLRDLALIMRNASMNYIVKRYSWDLYNAELDFEALSVSAVSLTVESQETKEIPAGSSGGSSSGGSVSSHVAWGSETVFQSVELNVNGTSKTLSEDGHNHDDKYLLNHLDDNITIQYRLVKDGLFGLYFHNLCLRSSICHALNSSLGLNLNGSTVEIDELYVSSITNGAVHYIINHENSSYVHYCVTGIVITASLETIYLSCAQTQLTLTRSDSSSTTWTINR